MPKPAARVVGRNDGAGPFVFICEHAANWIPYPIRDPEADLLETHWGWDIGAAALTEYLVRATDSVGVLATYSRLVCDNNRDPSEATWVLGEIEGRALSFNSDLSQADRNTRLALHRDYHMTVDRTIAQKRASQLNPILVSIHSFTPHFKGQDREMQIGVLYDCREAWAVHLAREIKRQGFLTALNQPYSGFDHLIYSVNRHGNQHQIPYFELEVRQDLLAGDQAIEDSGHRLLKALNAWVLAIQEEHHHGPNP